MQDSLVLDAVVANDEPVYVDMVGLLPRVLRLAAVARLTGTWQNGGGAISDPIGVVTLWTGVEEQDVSLLPQAHKWAVQHNRVWVRLDDVLPSDLTLRQLVIEACATAGTAQQVCADWLEDSGRSDQAAQMRLAGDTLDIVRAATGHDVLLDVSGIEPNHMLLIEDLVWPDELGGHEIQINGPYGAVGATLFKAQDAVYIGGYDSSVYSAICVLWRQVALGRRRGEVYYYGMYCPWYIRDPDGDVIGGTR